MAESVKDLPDPLEETPSASASSPDDLLAKMAEDAIDQLIADADNGREPPSAPPAFSGSADSFSPPADLTPPEALPRSAGNAAHQSRRHGDVAEPAAEAPRPAPAQERRRPELASDAAAVGPQGGLKPTPQEAAQVDPPAQAVTAAAAPPVEPTPESPASAEAGSSADVGRMPQSEALSPGTAAMSAMPHVEPLSLTPPSHEELDAVLKAAALSEPSPGPSSDAGRGDATLTQQGESLPAAEQPATGGATLAAPSLASVPVMPMPPPVDVPADIADSRADVKALLKDAARESSPIAAAWRMLIKPLEWLNAPFAYVSDRVRDAIGQVAIITLINALGVMLYVIFFRQK